METDVVSEGDPMVAAEVTTLLGQGSEFSGKLSFEGAVRVDGRFSGEIRSEGMLVIGPTAEVEADVFVRVVLVQGRVTGNITAEEAIEVRAPAVVTGKLVCPALSIERGVTFNGACDMRSESAPPPELRSPEDGDAAEAENGQDDAS